MRHALRTVGSWLGPTVLLAALIAGSLATAAAGQWADPPEVQYDNLPYNGRFTFARLRCHPSRWGTTRRQAWGLDLAWNHDYPRADQHLPEILELVSDVDANLGGSTIVRITDHELFDYPWASLCEVGYLTLTDEEVESLRNYVLKGGFVVVDDFNSRAWYNFEEQMQRVFPGGRWVELDAGHPIFNVFYKIDDISFGADNSRVGGGYGYGYGYGYPRDLALYEDNDPSKRLLMIANYNNDSGEYWEWSESDYLPIDLTNEAYKLGVNYVIYSMTH